MAVPSSNRSGVVSGREQRREKGRSTRKGVCSDFLNFQFENLSGYDLCTVTARCEDIDLPAIEGQVQEFLHVLGSDVEVEHSGNPYKDAANLIEQVKGKTDNEWVEFANVEDDKGNRHQELIGYTVCDFDTYHLFFLPVKIVTGVDDDLRNILMDFYAFLDWKGPFLSPKAHYDFQYQLGIMDMEDDCQIDPEQSEMWTDEYREWAESYVHGDINKIFEEIEDRRRKFAGNPEGLVNRICKNVKAYGQSGKAYYKTGKGHRNKVATLLDLIYQGIQITLEDNLFNYELRFIRYELGDNSFFDWDANDDMMDFDRQFALCFALDDEDSVVEGTRECLNNDAGNFGGTVLMGIERFSGEKKIKMKTDYPKRWNEWFEQFIKYTYE